MSITEEHRKLINKFLDETLNNKEKKAFKVLVETNKTFLNELEELAFTDAALEAIGHIVRNGQPKSLASKDKTDRSQPNKDKTINIKPIRTKITVAASILLFVACGTILYKWGPKQKVFISETVPPDTIIQYIPKKEFFNYEIEHAAVYELYAFNEKMNKIVDLSNPSLRGEDNREICYPANDENFKLGDSVRFNLSAFKPGEYRLCILGFYDKLEITDTIFNAIEKIEAKNKVIYEWMPNKAGAYYWLLYVGSSSKFYLARRFYIKT